MCESTRWERPSCLRLCECDCERHWSENREKGAEPAFYGPSRFSGAKPPSGGWEGRAVGLEQKINDFEKITSGTGFGPTTLAVPFFTGSPTHSLTHSLTPPHSSSRGLGARKSAGSVKSWFGSLLSAFPPMSLTVTLTQSQTTWTLPSCRLTHSQTHRVPDNLGGRILSASQSQTHTVPDNLGAPTLSGSPTIKLTESKTTWAVPVCRPKISKIFFAFGAPSPLFFT